jgi:DNA-binding GntR family transcriptional regulator
MAVEHRPLHEIVADRVKSAILNGDFYPGERLVEDRLAREFDVSRHPVREALRVLQTEGFVEISPRRGATVSRISAEEASELFEVLSALDGLAARLASQVTSVENLQRAKGIIAEARAILASGELSQQDLLSLIALNRAFHEEVAEAGKNRQLIDSMKQLRDRLQWLQAAGHRRRPELSWAEHTQILEAIDGGDSQAADARARAHIEGARVEYLAERHGARSVHPS